MKQTKLLIITLLLLAINSCKEEDKIAQSDRAYSPQIVQEEYGSASVVGFVVDKAGNPLDGVRVHFGEHVRITDGEGKFELREVSEGSGKRIWFEKEGYARTQKLVDAREDLPNRVDAALFQIAKSEKMTDAGGLIEGEDFSVDIQSGGFVYYDGEIVEVGVIVSVTPFLTSEEYFIDAFPGDFEGRREDGSTSAIESFGFIDVDLRDEFGEPVQMADGVIATIKIKAPENAPATIPMWWYDYKTPEWIEEGTGSLENGFYTAEVTHFTPWNWDVPIELRSTIIGRVVDNAGNPIEGARLVQTGINRTFQLSTKSEEDGTFEMLTFENMELELEAQFDIYGSTVLEKKTSSNQSEINNFGDIIIDVNIENVLPPSISNEELFITMGETEVIRGNYFGEEKREGYKLLLDGEEIETTTWQNDKIEFLVPDNIPEEGIIRIDRDGFLSQQVIYKEGDWSCEIKEVTYDNNGLQFKQDKYLINLGWEFLVEIPNCIGNLTNLEVLKLEENQLSSLPESIGNLSNLEQLWLHANRLISLPESFGNLTNLEVLRLFDNQLTKLPESLGNLQNLDTLYLNNNELTSLPESFGNLTNLEALWLFDNQLTTLPENFGNLTNLKVLWLFDNQLTTLPESFGNLNNFEEINLRNNELITLPESFGNLTNLKWLYLSRNQLSNIPESFGNFVNLQALMLQNNKLTSLPESIKNLSNNLRELYLAGNPIPETEKAKIASWLPYTDIIWE